MPVVGVVWGQSSREPVRFGRPKFHFRLFPGQKQEASKSVPSACYRRGSIHAYHIIIVEGVDVGEFLKIINVDLDQTVVVILLGGFIDKTTQVDTGHLGGVQGADFLPFVLIIRTAVHVLSHLQTVAVDIGLLSLVVIHEGEGERERERKRERENVQQSIQQGRYGDSAHEGTDECHG